MESTDYIFGIRAVIEAIEAGKEIDKVFIRKDLQGEALLKELLDKLHRSRAGAASAGRAHQPYNKEKPSGCARDAVGCHISSS